MTLSILFFWDSNISILASLLLTDFFSILPSNSKNLALYWWFYASISATLFARFVDSFSLTCNFFSNPHSHSLRHLISSFNFFIVSLYLLDASKLAIVFPWSSIIRSRAFIWLVLSYFSVCSSEISVFILSKSPLFWEFSWAYQKKSTSHFNCLILTVEFFSSARTTFSSDSFY